MTPAAATARRAAVIYNPTKVDVAKLRNTVATAESAGGWAKSLWLETTEHDPGVGQAATAREAGVDVVLAAGGDGTVRAVAEGLRGSDIALALLPAGTGNVLARNMDLNVTHLDDSVGTAFTGKDRRIDLGIVEIEREDGTREEMAFVVMAGLGLDAKMIANTNDELKRRVGWLAYVDAIVRSMRDSQKLRVRYRIDEGEEKTMSAHTVLVGNCGTLPGNVLLLPDAEIDDGVFDIVALRPEGFFGWAQVWVKIFWENGVLRRSSVGRKLVAGLGREIRTLRYLKASTITARLDRAEEFELDGDEYGKAVAFRAHIEPLALAVRVPADRELERPTVAVQDAAVA
ncbi:MAG TPA: diacylglycerol kinase family protein [Solirubrobacteraceae bacterium]|nr:diacylglycerol kinase family protein [Solirubrobacteraceae bacterium]